jgi:hypothetical protein
MRQHHLAGNVRANVNAHNLDLAVVGSDLVHVPRKNQRHDIGPELEHQVET